MANDPPGSPIAAAATMSTTPDRRLRSPQPSQQMSLLNKLNIFLTGILIYALLFMHFGNELTNEQNFATGGGGFRGALDRSILSSGGGAGTLEENEFQKEKQETKEVEETTSAAGLSWYEKPQPILAEFPPITRRLDFIHHLEKVPSFKTGIEVGVQRGILAKKSMQIWKSCKEYKLVDLWGKEEGYEEPGTDTAADKDANLRQARRRMKGWVERGIVEFFVMRSTDASKHLPDNHFDYIYLDARHDYCAVKEDIEHYWPKLRPGGILGGHDYIDAQYAIDKLGPKEDWSKCEDGSIHPEAVKGAVDEFRKQEGDLDVYTSDEDFPSWYVQMPYS